ncbi:hypothetical protein [Parasphingorhabdus sp.]|uniref:hypothetical protein n=1 Tax=Parasphingorhabdus sp. TaxID=2709688 RepID=UPI0035931221
MARFRLSLILLAVLPLLSGCVAALLPLAALGTIGKEQIDHVQAKQDMVTAGAIDLAKPVGSVTIGSERDAAEAVPMTAKKFTGQGGAIDVDLDTASADRSTKILQLAELETSPYASFAAHALKQSTRLAEGQGVQSVVLIPRVDIFQPETMECEGKPLAVVIDLDDSSSPDWMEAETLYRQNGLVEVLKSLRTAEISVIWLSDKPVAAAQNLSAILEEAGFSNARSDDFLFLDRGGDDRKQVRRWDAARNYCIVAMAGDDRSDFDELYAYLRDPNGAIMLESMFNNGWFLTPPPLVEATEAPMAPADDKEG